MLLNLICVAFALLCLLALTLLSFVVVCLVFSFIFITFCLLINILYNLIWAQGFLELTFRMYTKPAFISVFSGFLSSQNRQKFNKSKNKIKTNSYSLSLRKFFCLYVMEFSDHQNFTTVLYQVNTM